MITKLGVTSGDILTLFDEVKGPLRIREIEVYLGEPKEIILMSLGWLIREGLVNSEYVNGEQFYYTTKVEAKS